MVFVPLRVELHDDGQSTEELDLFVRAREKMTSKFPGLRGALELGEGRLRLRNNVWGFGEIQRKYQLQI